MKTTCAWFLLILFGLPVLGFAVSSLQIDSITDITFVNEPENVTIQCNLVTPGERVDIELYIDLNENGTIDSKDYRFDMLSLVDGIGWIRDPEAPENDIPGDENTAEGIITSTIPVTRSNHPCGRQTWLVRATGADETFATATIHWNISAQSSLLQGTVIDKYSNTTVQNELLFASDYDYPDVVYTSLSNESGFYGFTLEPGSWKIYAHTISDTLLLDIYSTKKIQKNIYLHPLDSFITGQVLYEDGTPVTDFMITAQNTELFQFYSTSTDQNGQFILNVDHGSIDLSCSPALTSMFGTSAWPEEYYAAPQQRSLHVAKGQNPVVDIQLKKYAVTLNGKCTANGEGLEGVLVQGAAKNSTNGEIQFFQTYTRKDGSYSLGVSNDKLISLVAQKTGYSLHPETGYININPTVMDKVSENYNFDLREDKPLMTISGTLYNDDLTPAVNVPVIAYNKWEKSAQGYIIQKTNDRGEFCFHPEVEGSWQIGLYKKDYKSIPPLHYLYVNEGMAYTDIKFYLYLEKDYARFVEGHFKPTALNIIPNQPLPFEAMTSIQFVLPESRRTRVQLLDMNGHPLRTLVDEKLSGGIHTIAWDGADNNGTPLSSGIYVCRIDAVNESMLQTITLIR